MSEAQGKFPRRAFINPLGWHKGAMCEQVMATEVRANSLQSEYLSKEESDARVNAAEEFLWSEIHEQNPTLHFCSDWDFMLIDKRDDEFECCHCFDKSRAQKEQA